MIEKTVLDYLNDRIPSVPSFMETPEDEPDEFIRIEKTGSSVENQIERATFAIQSYARSLYRASEINEMVKEAMDSIYEIADVFTAYRNTDYNFTDEETKHYRYQAVYQIVY